MSNIFAGASQAPSSRWFTLTHLQEYLNREDRDALRKLLRNKGIPMTAFGREYFIGSDDFLAWLEANKSTQSKPKLAADDDGGSEAA